MLPSVTCLQQGFANCCDNSVIAAQCVAQVIAGIGVIAAVGKVVAVAGGYVGKQKLVRIAGQSNDRFNRAALQLVADRSKAIARIMRNGCGAAGRDPIAGARAGLINDHTNIGGQVVRL